MSVQFFRIIHQPGFEHSLHYCIKEKAVVAAPIEIEDSDPPVFCPVQIAVADIALNSISRFSSQRSDARNEFIVFLYYAVIKISVDFKQPLFSFYK